MDAKSVAKRTEKKQRNWWKYAFFVALLAFELAREIAVLASARGAVPNGSAVFSASRGYVTVTGRWRRSDGAREPKPSLVRIECEESTRKCVEAHVTTHDEFVYAPELDWFEAKFTPEAVTYENDNPDCATYRVRLDFQMERAFSVRERKENPENPYCKTLEPRLSLEIGDAYDPAANTFKGHFVPLMSALAFIL